MSGLSWAEKAKAKAADSKASSKLGEASHPKLKKKAGRKKSLVERKSLMLSTSDYQAKQIKQLEVALTVNGLDVKRGRSETVELAVAYLLRQLKDEDTARGVIIWLGAVVGAEDAWTEEQKEV
jgi:hypothetical protein